MSASPFSATGEITLRERLASLPKDLDWALGLRAAICLCVFLAVVAITGDQRWGWASLGAFEAVFTDQGGPYRTRLTGMLVLSLAGSFSLGLGNLAGGALHWALPATVIYCFVWTYLSVLGQPFTLGGVIIQVVYICGLGSPTGSPHEALLNSLVFLTGGVGATAISLFLWPFDPYRPARTSAAACFRELALFHNSVVELSKRRQRRPKLWERLGRYHQNRVRKALEEGWRAVAFARAAHQAETPQGQNLVVLLETADLVLARTVAVVEQMQAEAGEGVQRGLENDLSDLLEQRDVEQWIASLLVSRRGVTTADAERMRQTMRNLPEKIGGRLIVSSKLSRFLLAQVAKAAAQLESAIESVVRLRLGNRRADKLATKAAVATGHFHDVHRRLQKARQRWELYRLISNFNVRSLIFRHAARVAAVCGLDVLLMLVFHIDHGFWLLLTSLIVLQPHVSATMRRGRERIVGTVLGCLFTAVLAYALHDHWVTLAVLFVLGWTAMAIRPVSFTIFIFFLTPTLTMAWMPNSGDWRIAYLRMINALIGAAISLIAMRLLFPLYEISQTPRYLKASVAADRRYLEVLKANWLDRQTDSRKLAYMRRMTGLAHNDTEESLDRLVGESWPRRRPIARFATAFATYLRRFAQGVTVLAGLEGDWSWKLSGEVQDRLELLNRRLLWLEAQMESPSCDPWPEAPDEAEASAEASEKAAVEPQEEHTGERQLARLERQSEILYQQIGYLRENGWIPGMETRCP